MPAMGFRIKGANMFGFGKKEAPQPQQEETKETGDQTIEKALNDPGFTEFLSKYPNRVELSDENAEEVKSRYERYQQVGKTIKEVQSVLAKEFSNEISTDALKISINPSEIEGARDYLEDMAVNNEGEFDRILETIQEYHATSQAADEAIEEVKQRFEELEKKQETLNDVKEISGFKRWTRLGLDEREKQAIADAKKLKLNVRSPQKSEQRLDREGYLANRQVEWDVTDKLNEYDKVRMELMISLGENTGALKLAKDKLAQKLTESIGTSLNDVDKASSAYNQMEGDFYNSDLTFDYLGSNPDFDRIDYMKKLNEESENRVTEAIKSAVTTSPVINGQMARLESTLDPYLKRESLGTKTQNETREFVLGVVHELFAEYVKAYQEPDKRNKSWLLQRILEKNGIQSNENYKSNKQLEEEQVAEEKRQTAEAVANPDDWDVDNEISDQEEPVETDSGKRSHQESREVIENQEKYNKELTESINGQGEAISNNPEDFNQPPSLSNEELEQMDPNQAEVERQKKAAIDNLANTTQNIANQKEATEKTPQAPIVEPPAEASAREESEVLSQEEIEALLHPQAEEPVEKPQA
jgi:hypothetical protein